MGHNDETSLTIFFLGQRKAWHSSVSFLLVAIRAKTWSYVASAEQYEILKQIYCTVFRRDNGTHYKWGALKKTRYVFTPPIILIISDSMFEQVFIFSKKGVRVNYIQYGLNLLYRVVPLISLCSTCQREKV